MKGVHVVGCGAGEVVGEGLDRELKAQVRQSMDQQWPQREQRLEKTQEAKDTTTMWGLISASMEAAFIEFLGLDKRDAKKMRGRGTVTIETRGM